MVLSARHSPAERLTGSLVRMDIVPEPIEGYMEGLAARYDEPVVTEMEAYASEHGFPIVGRLCGVTIELLARAIGARRVFELGSGFGYSAYWFSRATGADGEIHCTDGDPNNEARARGYLERAGYWDRVSYHVSDAVEALEATDGDFDVVYCDIDKHGYPDAWRASRDRIRPGGLWICDNTLWSGRVAIDEKDENTRAIDEHNRLVSADPDFVTTIVPTRDGLMAALRIG